jgi:hypothetical protein
MSFAMAEACDSRFSRIQADRLVLKCRTGTILGGVVAFLIKTSFA